MIKLNGAIDNLVVFSFSLNWSNSLKKIVWWSHENDFFSKINTI